MARGGLLDRIGYLLSVPRCVSCKAHLDYGERALCPKCSGEFARIKMRNCSRCAKILSLCDCSNEYLEAHFVKRVVKVFRYKNREENLPANSLIYSLKHDNRADVLTMCADELLFAISNSVNNLSECIITNVPRRRSQIIKNGFDHAELLAREIAKRVGAEYKRLLKSNVKKAQKSMFGKDRLQNISFDITEECDLKGKTVIVVDDIITTGASMGACGMLLRGLGTRKIIGAALAIAYKDNHSYI